MLAEAVRNTQLQTVRDEQPKPKRRTQPAPKRTVKIKRVRRYVTPRAKAAKVSLDGLCPLRLARCAASSGARTLCLFFVWTHSLVRCQCVGPTIPDFYHL
jgi:hypothetical protein